MSDTKEDEGTGIAPNDDCGCDYPELGYSWIQGESDVTVTVPVPSGTKGKMVVVDIGCTKLKVGLKGKEPVIDGELFARVKQEDCMWSIEDGNKLVITLEKANLKYEEWWEYVIKGHPAINMKKLKPPPKKLQTLDEGAQATIEKMMFDQHQKRMGKPTSDELKIQEAMEKFKEQFPGQPLPDMSNVKFSG
eukprot:TRINITY_DN13827_c0_g1_i1.p1 TRINITY_DN13827_c0_g1~~TRINITY_DN13827_c0_g1_i1.p1  ORF type:complete len:191 (+),score=36.14 TRINITY_DN13827_c0_g1_i1:55-627(+)